MLKDQKNFVFIMLKPAAAKNKALSTLIKKELSNYGTIKYLRESVTVERQKIAEHYQAAKSSYWYPLLIHYLSHRTVQHFILEAKENYQDFIDVNHREYSFADFLRTKLIGPSNVFKTKECHIRRLALSSSAFFLLDNLIHCSDSTESALTEIQLWYEDEPLIVEEFAAKALVLSQ